MSSQNEHLYTLKAGIAAWRRILFLLLIIVPTVFCSGYMAYLLPHQGSTTLELVVLILFTTLFVWISMGFFKQGLEGLKSTPALNRGHMLPVKFDQLPEWLSTESFLTTMITQLRPLLIPLLILFNILLLMGLFFWL